MNQSAINQTVKVNKAQKLSYRNGIREIVRVNDGGLLNFFYPDFIVKDTIFFNQSDNVIYVGERKADTKQYLREKTHQFINTVGEPDIDFTNRLELLDFVCGKWRYDRKDVYQTTEIEFLLQMDEANFLSYIKQLWLSGKHSFALKDNAIAASVLFEHIAMQKGRNHVIFEIIEGHNEDYLETILISFLERAYSKKQSYSSDNYYQAAAKEIRQRVSAEALTTVLARYRKMKKSKRMKLLWLITFLSHQHDETA